MVGLVELAQQERGGQVFCAGVHLAELEALFVVVEAVVTFLANRYAHV